MVAGRSTDSVRVRPAIRRLALWLGPVLLLIAAWQIWDALEARRFAAEQERVLPGGPAGEERDRRKAIENDAAPYYVAANVAAVVTGPWLGLSDRPVSAFEITGRFRAAVASGTEVDGEIANAVPRLLAAFDLPLRLIDEASGREYGSRRFPVEQPYYRYIGLVPAGRTAGTQTLELMRRGETSAAVRSLIARTRLLRAYDEDPDTFGVFEKATEAGVIAGDIAIVLSQTNPADADLVALEAALAGAYRNEEVTTVIRSMTRSQVGRLESVWNGRRVDLWPTVVLVRPALRHHAVLWARTTADTLSAAQRPWPERLEAIEQVADRPSMLDPVLRPLTRNVLIATPASEEMKRLIRTMAAAVAAVRSARGAIAIEQHRRAAGFPDRLEDLPPPAGDREALVDPFTGESLRYARHDDGYTVYSVGRDLRDDGGKLIADLTPGRATPVTPPPDIGVRVRYRFAAATNASNSARNSPVR